MKIKNKLFILGLILALSLSLAACGVKEEDSKVEETGKELDEKLVVTHELGTTEIENKVEKVVVFDYGLLDILDNLDESVVIGMPKASSIPPYLEKYEDEKYENIGSLFEPDFEHIFELKPDLILISGRQADLYEELSEIAPTVYLPIDGENYFESFERNVDVIGEILGKEELAEEKILEIKNKADELNEMAKKSGKTGLFLMANDGNLSAYGETSRFGMLYKEFGVEAVDKNIESTTHGQKVSFEYILEKNPDILYVMDRAVIAGGDTSAEQVMNNELIHSTDAYKNDKIIYLDAHVWYVSSGGITGTEKMIEEITDSLD